MGFQAALPALQPGLTLPGSHYSAHGGFGVLKHHTETDAILSTLSTSQPGTRYSGQVSQTDHSIDRTLFEIGHPEGTIGRRLHNILRSF